MSKGSRRGRRGPKRNYTPVIILVLVVVLGVTAYYIFSGSGIGQTSPLINKPADPSVLNELYNVSPSTLNSVGIGPSGLVALQSTTSNGQTPSPLTLNGKPEILYIGAEYCPYCAAERWVMITALDKFGNFTGIDYMQSASSPEPYPNTSTFTFVNANYTSNYISFVAIEQKDRAENALMTPTSAEQALMNQYDSAGSIPFVDFANQYTLVGSQFVPQELRVGGSPTAAPLNWTDVASQVNSPSSVVAQNIDGATNRLIAAICKIDGGQPVSVCNQTYAQAVAFIRNAPSNNSQLGVSETILTGSPQSVVTGRFAPARLTTWV